MNSIFISDHTNLSYPMVHRINLTLSDAEVKLLLSLIKDTDLEGLKTALNTLAGRADQEAYIRQQVYQALSDLSGYQQEAFNDSSDLKADLGLSNYHKRSLKNYFQNTIESLGSKEVIAVKECETLTKVIDCLNLVNAKL
ncbi:hypothetical protein [Dyadobacter tibetensis]|uniref:hypothetical protein n=1 Tax=Dyadobacter tibetensis TaxID=1211851 RepID=UPI00103F1A61|nr:hypothetical protein [Dyadobacter tibetensis]